jgi:hypothetical protein
MEDIERDYYLPGEFTSQVNSFVRFLKAKSLKILAITLLCTLLGLIYYYLQKPKYEAEVTFILEEKSGSGGLAGLASQFGFNLGSMGNSAGIFSGDNILDILKSKKVVQYVLLTTVDSSSGSKTLADLYVNIHGPKGYSFNNALQQKDDLKDSILNIIYTSIVQKHLTTERVRKQGSIIKVKLTASDRVFAKLMTDRMVNEAARLYLEARTGTAQDNIRHLQLRADSILRLLNNKSFGAASVQMLDVNPGVRSAVVPVEIATRDKSVLATIYIEVVKNLEASKLILSQESPVIQLLDSTESSMVDKRKSVAFLLILSCLSGLFLGVGGFSVVYFLRNSNPVT